MKIASIMSGYTLTAVRSVYFLHSLFERGRPRAARLIHSVTKGPAGKLFTRPAGHANNIIKNGTRA